MISKIRPVVIIGAGGHGKEVLEALTLSPSYRILGFIDEDKSIIGKKLLGIPVLGNLNWMQENIDSNTGCICAIGTNQIRKDIVSRLQGRFTFVNAIHPTAFVSPSAKLGRGITAGIRAVINTEASIGNHVIINTLASISHDVKVHDFCNLNPGSTVAGKVHLGEGAYIGANSTVIQNLSIGDWSVIGAGAVVIRDVEHGKKVAGVPAIPI